MAKKKAQKRKQRFDPTAQTGFKNRKAFNKKVRVRAKSQVQPQLNDIRQRSREERGAHETRGGEIDKYYGFDLAARQAAQDRLQSSMNSILGRSDVMGDDAQAGLAAALRQQAEAAGQAAGQVGGYAPTMDPALQEALGAYATGNQMGLAGDAAAYLGRGAADIGITGVEGRTAGLEESQRHASAMDALRGERSDVRATLPGLREQARAGIMQEQLAIGQQNLAEDQFGHQRRQDRFGRKMARKQHQLARDQFGEQRRAGQHQRGMDEARFGLETAQLELARQELQANVDAAQTEEQRGAAQAKAERFDKAAQWLEGYFEPNERDNTYDANRDKDVFDQNTWRQNRNFNEAFQGIKRKFGLSPVMTYRVLMTSPIREWRLSAQQKLKDLKRARRNPGSGRPGAGTGVTHGPPGQGGRPG